MRDWLANLWRRAGPQLALVAVVFIVWGPSLFYGFVWDDRPFIVDNRTIQTPARWPEIFYRLDAQSSMPEGFVLFRPLRTLHYALVYSISGEPDPFWHHAANLVWHAIAAILVFAVAKRLFLSARAGPSGSVIAWLCALGFAVHPVTSEVVCWIKSLDDIMATVFTLACVWEALRESNDGEAPKMNLPRAALWCALAFYSKESAVPLIAALFLIFRVRWNLPIVRALLKCMPFVAIGALYVVHRHWVIGRTTQTAPISGTHAQTLLDTVQAVPHYFRLLFGAPPFIADYTHLRGGYALTDAPILIGLALLLGLIAAGVWMHKRGWQIASMGLAWTALFLAPVSNLLPMMQYMAERFLYLPLVGWLFACGALFFRDARLSRGRLIAVALVFGVWSWLSVVRAPVWTNDFRLFRDTYSQAPSPRAAQNLVASVFQFDNVRSIFAYDRATGKSQLRRVPTRAEADVALGSMQHVATIIPQSADLHAAIGTLLAVSGRPADAIRSFEKATELRPNDAALWVNLAQANIERRAFSEADAALGKALAINPNHIEAIRSESQLRWLQEDYARALEALRRLKAREPNNPQHDYWIREAESKLQ